MAVKLEYVLLGLGAVGLTYWYFFIRTKPPVPPEGYTLAVKVEEV